MLERALTIHEAGGSRADVANSLHNLGFLLYESGAYDEARPLYDRALAIGLDLRRDHPKTAETLNCLGLLDLAERRPEAALPRFEEARAIYERALGPRHPRVAAVIDNQGIAHVRMGEPARALPFFEQALAIREEVLGPEHGEVANALTNLAGGLRFLARYAPPDPATLMPTTYVIACREPADEAARWVAAVLPEAVDGVPDDEVEALLPAWDVPVRRALGALGFGVAKVDLAGDVGVALERFRARWGEPPPAPPGARDAVPADADGIVALCREVFSAEPAYGAHLAQERFLSAERDRIAAGLPPGLHRVLEIDGRVRGLVQATHQVPNPHHGTSAGLNLVLGPELRGRGLARWAYGEILTRLRADGIAWLKGATARPAVMHVARVLGRGVTGVTLRRDVAFPEGWFDAILP